MDSKAIRHTAVKTGHVLARLSSSQNVGRNTILIRSLRDRLASKERVMLTTLYSCSSNLSLAITAFRKPNGATRPSLAAQFPILDD